MCYALLCISWICLSISSIRAILPTISDCFYSSALRWSFISYLPLRLRAVAFMRLWLEPLTTICQIQSESGIKNVDKNWSGYLIALTTHSIASSVYFCDIRIQFYHHNAFSFTFRFIASTLPCTLFLNDSPTIVWMMLPMYYFGNFLISFWEIGSALITSG